MLKQLNWKSLCLSLTYIIAGVLLIVYPEVSADIISYVIGIGIIVVGIVNLTTYFLLDVRNSLNRNEFVVGLMCLLFGLAVIVKKDVIMNIVPVILGLIITISGFVKLQKAVVAGRIGYHQSGIYAILGVVSIILGVVVMFFISGEATQNMLFITIGIGLVYSGLSDLGASLFLARKFNQFIKRLEKAAMDADGNIINVEAVITDEPEESDVSSETQETPTDDSQQ